MKFLFISITLILQMCHIQGQNKFATCKREWSKIGCFNEKGKPSRALPEMLLNDRDRSSEYHEPGYQLNWQKWNQSQHSLACRCAEKARQKGYRVFGLQFYGECWSGPSAEVNYLRDGKSDNCIMNLELPTACVKDEPKECVGQEFTNYIYMLPTLEFKCSFDNATDLCGFTQATGDDFDWTINSGTTKSIRTGPVDDHTGGGFYIYIETSSPRKLGDKARISRWVQLTGNSCLRFFYNMNGESMGTLKVELDRKVIFKKSGDQGPSWKMSEQRLQGSGRKELAFEGIRGQSYRGDAAIDDIKIYDC